MATAERFEDLRCWQTARRLTNLVYEYSEEGTFANDFGLKDQIQRAGVSTMSNIAEGFNSRTTGRFIDYLGRARGSATEVQAQLYVALDRIDEDQFDTAYDDADKLSRQIYRFIRNPLIKFGIAGGAVCTQVYGLHPHTYTRSHPHTPTELAELLSRNTSSPTRTATVYTSRAYRTTYPNPTSNELNGILLRLPSPQPDFICPN